MPAPAFVSGARSQAESGSTAMRAPITARRAAAHAPRRVSTCTRRYDSRPMLPKAYIPADWEPEIDRRWQSSRAFHAEPGGDRPAYAIFIPPPNVTAALHVGHALNNTIQDVLIRRARMQGFNTLWMPGTDHAGISTQAVVEKRLIQQGRRRTQFTREQFVAQVQAWKDEYEATILAQLRAMGASCDFERTRFTMDPICALAVRTAFASLFAEGLIDRGKRLVNWDPVSGTALADDEVEMEEIDGSMWYLRYPLADGSGHVTVATTRPETMLGDTAVAMNPRDPRAPALRGKRVTLPIVGREIPIVEDDYVVLPAELAAQVGGVPGAASDPKAAFATGFLKVTPAHDPNDWDLGLRHGLAVVNVMAPDASISDRHGWSDASAEARAFVGLSREEARTRIVAWFRDKGLLEGVKPYRHAVGHSYRSNVPIEPYLSEQWYVLVTDDRMRGAALRAMAPEQRTGGDAARAGAAAGANAGAGASASAGASAGDGAGDGELRFFPSRYARTFESWHENLRDWCVSRQLWWGHRIPIWWRRGDAVGADARRAIDSGAGRIGRSSLVAVESDHSRAGCVHRVRLADGGEVQELLCVPEERQSLVPALEREGFRQDEDVLDTWFSSALWPLSTLGWPDPTRAGTDGMLETFNPSTVLCTAREIITLWVSRMVMFNRHFAGRLPFRNVYIHAVVQDGFGRKMSKSLGNGVDPRDIIRTHGADAMRFVLAQIATETQDVRLPIDMIDPHSGETFTPETIDDGAGNRVAAPIQRSPKDPSKTMVSFYGVMSGKAAPSESSPLALNTSSRFDAGRNFATKLWNAVRFALSSVGEPSDSSRPIDPRRRPFIDRWILARLSRAIAAVDSALDSYRFSTAVDAIYDFFWRDLCDWYLEAIKPTVRQDAEQQALLVKVLDATLRLIHPVCPFVTEALWTAVAPTSAQRPSITGLELAPSELCCTASWPRAHASLDDEAALALGSRSQALVEAVRTLRGERRVTPKRRISLATASPILSLVRNAGGVIEALAGIETISASDEPGFRRPADATPIPFEGTEVILSGLVDGADASGERTRLSKLIEERRRAIAGFESKLGNAGYMAKAPKSVVDETRRMLEQAREDLVAAERS
ncbi:MAG: valine--tRNA ligase, partial [Phycisphaerae bacterium]|nr:valine--tRNA ligase [Phycisphaerae bacterium]